MTRTMRPDYNKPWRCPVDGCPGSTAPNYSADSDQWTHAYKPHWTAYKCPTCGIRILPFILRWIEPAELLNMLKWKIRDWKYDRECNK